MSLVDVMILVQIASHLGLFGIKFVVDDRQRQMYNILCRVAKLSHKLGQCSSVNASVPDRVIKLFQTESDELLNLALDLCYSLFNDFNPKAMTIWGSA